MKKGFVLLISLCTLSLFSQKTLTLDDIVTNRSLYPDGLSQLGWLPSSNQYAYITEKDSLLVVDIRKETSRIFIDKSRLNDYLPDSLREATRFPYIRWHSDNTFSFRHDGYIFSYTVGRDSLNTRIKIPNGAQRFTYTDNYHYACVVDDNLYVGKGLETPQQLTEDGSREIVYGDAAYRREFGISQGLFWYEKGDRLAFYRIDQHPVKDYPLTNYATTPASTTLINYPMNGDSSEHTTVGIYNVATDELVYLEATGPYDQYYTNLTWSPDGNYLYAAVLNRGQDTMQLQQFDGRSGVFIKTLFVETHSKYVEPEHGPIFLETKTGEFLWFSERSGFQHLYHYDTDGVMLGQKTSGNFDVTGLIGLDSRERYMYVTTTAKSPLERHVLKVDLEDGDTASMTQQPGVHRAQLSYDGRYLLDEYSNTSTPGVTQRIETRRGEVAGILHRAENPLADYELPDMEFVTLEAKDGTPLYGRLIKPANFNSSKKYPAIIYVYGGPHVQLIRNSWLGGAQLFLYYLAQQGYVVFTLDSRGSAGRGLDFEQAIFRNMGGLEVADQTLVGADYLRKQRWVDNERIGVHGWSYGGFMTMSMLLKQPDYFKVGVAGGPVTDWRLYEIMYGERYMDNHQDNPEGFKNSNLSNYVEKLEGKRLLMIHGQQDDVVLPQHSIQFIQAAIAKGQRVDFFPYASHPHNVRGKDRIHLFETIVDYFDRHL